MSLANRIAITVLHSDPMAHAGLSAALSVYPDFELLGAEGPQTHLVATTAQAMRKAADVVVADFDNGLAMAVPAKGGRYTPNLPRVVVIAATSRECEIRRALERGVRGYLLFGCKADELAISIRAVNRGGRYLSPVVAARIAESMAAEPLTAREEEVICLVAQGLCNKSIGRQLGIAVGTVKSHLNSAFEKLNVESRTQAMVVVERRGLLRHRGTSADDAMPGMRHAW